MQRAPANVEVWESGDTVETQPAGRHHVVPPQRLLRGAAVAAAAGARERSRGSCRTRSLNRTFGGRILADGFVQAGPAALASPRPATDFHVRIVTHAAQTPTLDDWKTQLTAVGRDTADGDEAMRTTAQWWDAFWKRSWIFVEGEGGEAVTRAYVLQRWMTAAGGRGAYPIKFNGSIFTVDPEFSGGPRLDADWRRWGDCYWWQNTRLPYFAMIARGDFDELSPLFRMYEAAVPLAQARMRTYFNAAGVVVPRDDDDLRDVVEPRLRLGPHGPSAQRGAERLHPPHLAAGARTGRPDARLLRAHARRAVPRAAVAADGARRAAVLRHALRARARPGGW